MCPAQMGLGGRGLREEAVQLEQIGYHFRFEV